MTGSKWLTITSTAAVAAAAVAGATWFATTESTQDPPRPFWQLISSESGEYDPPTDVDEVAKRSDAIVLAHITGVKEGRVDTGWLDPTPGDPRIPPPKTVFVQLTVDRVVAGGVTAGQVLNFEMSAPPQPLTIDAVRDHIPPGQLMFFLYNRAASGKRDGYAALVKPEDHNIWNHVSGRAVLAEGPTGLYTPLERATPPEYLASFDATTLEGAAARSAQAPR